MALLLVGAATATATPIMTVSSAATTNAAPGDLLTYYVTISNIGDTPTDGSQLTLTADLPTGLTHVFAIPTFDWDCSTIVPGDPSGSCTSIGVSDPHDGTRNQQVLFFVEVAPDADGPLTAEFHLSGGGAASVDSADMTVITTDPTEFGVDSFDGQVAANATGDPFTQAGGHPYSISTSVFFNAINAPNPSNGGTWPVEQVRNIFVDLPPGLVGDPTSASTCTVAQLVNTDFTEAKPLCPPGSQVGVATVLTTDGLQFGNPLPVFNLVPPVDVPARFGFNVAGTIVTMDAELRSGTDYGLSVNVKNVPEGLAIAGTQLTFWGVPADSSHDIERSCPGELAPWAGGPSCTTELEPRAFLRNPTMCTEPGVGLETTLRIDSWADPGDFKTASFVSHNPPAFPYPSDQWGTPQGPTGCDDVPFEPTFTAAPNDPAAGAPSAFTFDLTLPQSDDPDEIGTGDLKKAVVTLPQGVRVSPSSASGLGACTPAQVDLDSAAPATCPSSSKIGTVTIDTPLLDEQLKGSIYLAKPNDNPFGTLLSIYLVAKGPGLIVKLPGKVDAHPITGQLTATFDDNPQLPFEKLHLEFKGGPRAALVNPPSCGTYVTHAVLTSWSGATVASDSSFEISQDGNGTPCPGAQFSPDFEAGGSSVEAGGSTTFDLALTRGDDDEEIKSLSVGMPLGLLAKVAGVPLCDADTAGKAGTCSEASRIGDVLTGAGAGTHPFYLPGRVYLTDAYDGGPFGLSIVVPAVAGPFDLGTVVVRASVRLDKRTAQLRVVSDPLPEILEGIRLQIRDVRVSIDRDDFMVNPTSCLQKQVTGSITSTGGKTADVASRFQVGGCSDLKLRPRMSLFVGKKGKTRPAFGRSTPLVARLTQTAGQSNLKSVRVVLPMTLNALLPVVNDACTEAEFAAGDCENARTGRAVAVTPLLDKPLRGNAYFVKRPQGGLPNLVVALRGQVDFDLVGRITIPGSKRLATTFGRVPDVPIESFTLRMATGENGAIGIARNLCTKQARRAKAGITFRGQNGALIRSSQPLHIRGCRGGKKAK